MTQLPAEIDLLFAARSNSGFSVAFNQNQQPFDFSGAVNILFALKRNLSDAMYSLVFTSEGGGVQVQDNVLTINMSAEDVDELQGVYFYAIAVNFGDGSQRVMLKGRAKFNEVTTEI